MPRAFYHLLANNLIANVTNFFVWATAIYWVYLETNSVLGTSLLAGIYLVVTAACGIWFGSLVDHNRKKIAMLGSSVLTFSFFIIALGVYLANEPATFKTLASVPLWVVVVVLLLGVIAGNIRMIALPTAVALLVPEDKRDRANGMSGMVFGASFALSNVAAGVGLGFLGFAWVLGIALALTAVAALHLAVITIDETAVATKAKEAAAKANAEAPTETQASAATAENTPTPASPSSEKKIDLRGTIAAVRTVPGLLPLILFTTFNNFLGGIFMALMDAYGLSLVSVEFWGTLWGVLSLGFILGGLYISKYGLGKNPVSTIFKVNMLCWTVCIVMTLQPNIWLLAGSLLVWMCVVPFVEACEQTVLQKVVPTDRLGRVIGFAQSVEMSAAPLTAFLIGPIAQFFFIPFMTTGRGVELIGSWYGTGHGRGIGLVFVTAGVIGLIVTTVAWRSRAFKLLAKRYLESPEKTDAPQEEPTSGATAS